MMNIVFVHCMHHSNSVFQLQLEQEAIAHSKLGYVYDKVIKKEYQSQVYYQRAIQFAMALNPKTFNDEGKSLMLISVSL